MANDALEKVGTGIGAAVGITVVLLIVANIFVPVGLSSVSGDVSTTYNQSVGDEAISLNAFVDVNVTKATEGVSATITANDTQDGNAAQTANISVGSSNVFSLSGGDVNATVEHVNTSDSAVVTYTYPNDYGLGSGVGGMLTVLGTFGALAILLLFVAWAIREV